MGFYAIQGKPWQNWPIICGHNDKKNEFKPVVTHIRKNVYYLC
jgi:hypothetical protein